MTTRRLLPDGRTLALLLPCLVTTPVVADTLQLPPAGLDPSRQGTINCAAQPSTARAWNEQMLAAIHRDPARPTVHARNLFHVSAAMYDAWAAYLPAADQVLHAESASAADPQSAQAEAISFAAFRLLNHRFADSPGAPISLPDFQTCMTQLGHDPGFTDTTGNTPAALGNRIAETLVAHGLGDGSNEANSYVDYSGYFPANNPMLVQLSGTGGMADPNAWQPLIPPGAFGVQSFLTPFWSQVEPFAIARPSPGQPYMDPGPPPRLGGAGDLALKQSVVELIRASAALDPDSGQLLDISPAVVGNNSLGTDDGSGYAFNPVTGQPYPPNVVRLGDFGRVMAEFWADGPASTTPPGHWNEIANAVVDHPDFERRMTGAGPELDRLEWDVKLYLALNGALHDSAIVTWEVKRNHDSARPISLIREMGSFGQSSNPSDSSWHPMGLPLEPGLIELITAQSSAPGERHAHLAAHINEIAVLGWLGHPTDATTEYGGVGWILAVDWWPYQQADFVTPPFAGYTSGHSGFSRAAAEVLTLISGSPWFPGGLGGYTITADGPGYNLQFEYGPSEPVELQWVSYYDAADEAGQSRVWGGIHPPFDDYTGRLLGAEVGTVAMARALELFGSPPPTGC